MSFIENALVDVRSSGFTMLERFAGSFLPDMQVFLIFIDIAPFPVLPLKIMIRTLLLSKKLRKSPAEN